MINNAGDSEISISKSITDKTSGAIDGSHNTDSSCWETHMRVLHRSMNAAYQLFCESVADEIAKNRLENDR